ncbi:MAG: hypothetical protein M3340_15950 [Actinomycetota bacterium]|nr:hypothetical protein [Actinomycetota bacterium]
MLAFLAACVGAFFAWLPYEVFCVVEGADENPCTWRRAEFVWTLALGVAGLVAAGGMLMATYLGRGRLALAFFALALALNVASLWLSDAAVHGWDGLKYFPSL